MLFDPIANQLPPMLREMALRNMRTSNDGTSRRDFLKIAGIGGLALGTFPSLVNAQAGAPPKPPKEPTAFLHIDPDGTTTITMNRLEFGQGTHTGLAMILADELDADWSRVKGVHGSNDPAYIDPVFGMHITGGSGSMAHSFTQYRELGARARMMLVGAAAKEWKVGESGLHTSNGYVIAPNGDKLAYGHLAEAAMAMPVPETVQLKDPKDFKRIGKPTGRLDARAKSSGQQSYGIDRKLPGMLTASIARPDVFGAKLKSVDDSQAKSLKGVVAVLRVPLDRGGEGVAVIADRYWTARRGRDLLRVVWDRDSAERVDSVAQLAQYRALASTPGPKKYDADMSKLDGAAHVINAEYLLPYLAHAPMEPLNCTVAVKGDKVELWVGTQMPGLDGMAAAKVLGVPPDNVKVNVEMAGGGFGRRAIPSCDYVTEAAGVMKAAMAAGITAPVRTLWTREDDIRGGYYRPMHLHTARIGFDDKGDIAAWDHVIVGQSIMAGTFFEPMMTKDGIDSTTIEGMRDPYDVPMRLTVHHPKVNVPVLWWRAVGSTHTAFVMETLVDEVARTVKVDPVAYRLRLIGDKHPRHKAALLLAVEKSGYGKKTLPAGHGWGVAMHEAFDSVVAYVVVASMEDGRPKLHEVTAGLHCNRVVNPTSLEAQVQGGALMGLATCMPGGAITLKDGVVQQGNFDTYRVPRMSDMPKIAVHAVPSEETPTGMGEPGLAPLAPAFANAISRLTGKPIRELPFRV